jgi:putative oxidoreductase
MSTITQSKSSASRSSSGPRGLGAILSSYSGQTYALLRIVGGLAMAFHGMMKVFGMYMPAEYVPKLFTQGWFGGYIELIGGILVAVGAFTPYAAFLVSGTMAVAYSQFHWKFAFDSKFFPAVNQGELALVYAFLFLYFACRGSGIWSVDSVRNPLNTR